MHMPNDGIAKAKVLVESLPYLREFSGKTLVIKYDAKSDFFTQ